MSEEEHLQITGLTAADAAARLAADGPNELPSARPRSFVRQALDVVREPMLLLLLGAGVVNFLLAEPIDGGILLSFVLVVIGITLYQERKTENALNALRDLSSPRALVIRDGERQRIAGRDVAFGDVLVLAEGDRVPADAALVQCMNLSVDESALTGESVPVRKGQCATSELPDELGRPGGEDTPWVYSGTLVVKGQGLGVVRATGVRTELGRIGKALQTIEPERTRLQKEIDRLVRTVALLGLGAASVVVVAYGLTRGNWLEGLLAGIATAMAMLPEEFPVVLTVFLALGAWRLSQHHVLTRRPAAIETLGSATVLCVDKTGTLTQNRMTVRELIVDGEVFEVGEAALPERFHEIAEFAVLASPIDPFDPMDTAFVTLGRRYLADTEHLHSDWELVREYPLSENLLALSHVWRSPNGSDYVIAAKGAPEAIADLCHFDTHALESLIAQVTEATSGGQRVLAVARASFNVLDGLPSEQHDFEFRCLGLVGLHDPVRPGVDTAVAECSRAGVRTVMITGDYPGTALAIAEAIGLAHRGSCVTGPELMELGEKERAERIRGVSVFARMVPEQKLDIVRALQGAGEVVGMTGDGVNDAPALRASDIGIAMGERGTDVARESAALVITDDDYTSIVGAVRRGRAIFDNLRKAMAYIIAVHVPIAGMALVPVFVPGWPLVLLPLQIAFLELIIDPACSIAFEAEPADPEIMSRPPRKPTAKMFDRRTLAISVLQGLAVLAAVFAVYVYGIRSGESAGHVRALTFSALVLGNLGLILVNRSWRLTAVEAIAQRPNKALAWVVGVALVSLAALLLVPPLRELFRFEPVTWRDLALALLAAIVAVGWFDVYKLVLRRSGRRQSPR